MPVEDTNKSGDTQITKRDENGYQDLCGNRGDLNECPKELPNFTDYLKNLSSEASQDISALYGDKNICTINSLLQYDSAKWLRERPEKIVKVLSEICQFSESALSRESRETFALAKIIELIYATRNSRLQLPISFLENLHVYSLTHSKQLAQ